MNQEPPTMNPVTTSNGLSLITQRLSLPVVTMATPGYYSDCAERLAWRCNDLKIPFRCYPIKEQDRCMAVTRKPEIIRTALKDFGSPVWWMDADDLLTAPFDDPGKGQGSRVKGEVPGVKGQGEESSTRHLTLETPFPSFGWVRNPELSVIETELWLAGCVHYWGTDSIATDFLGYWEELCQIAPNDHRALIMAYYGFRLWLTEPHLFADVTSCVAGRYIMTPNPQGTRPEARL